MLRSLQSGRIKHTGPLTSVVLLLLLLLLLLLIFYQGQFSELRLDKACLEVHAQPVSSQVTSLQTSLLTEARKDGCQAFRKTACPTSTSAPAWR